MNCPKVLRSSAPLCEAIPSGWVCPPLQHLLLEHRNIPYEYCRMPVLSSSSNCIIPSLTLRARSEGPRIQAVSWTLFWLQRTPNLWSTGCRYWEVLCLQTFETLESQQLRVPPTISSSCNCSNSPRAFRHWFVPKYTKTCQMNTMYSNFTWKNDSLNHWNLGVFSNPLDKSKGELLQHSELGAPSMPAAAWSKLEQPRLEHHYHKDIQTPGKTFVF